MTKSRWKSDWIARIRLIVFCVFVGAMLMTVNRGFAQSAAGPAPSASGASSPRQPTEGVFDLIAHNIDGVFVTIVLLSIVGLTLIIQGFIQSRREVFMPTATLNTIRELIAQKRFKELIDFTEADPSFVSRALNPALKRAPSFAAMKEAMETALGEQTAEQFRRIEYLNIIGNLGPLLGLLGTVLGMIDAFQALHAAEGQANPADLAYGISKALTHTMLGLLLAVPCLAAFGVLRTMVDRLTVQGAMEAEDILLMIRPVETRPGATAPRPGAVPQPAGVMPLAPVRKAPLPAPLPMPSTGQE
jgi:biopolymer transport protein ExbB